MRKQRANPTQQRRKRKNNVGNNTLALHKADDQYDGKMAAEKAMAAYYASRQGSCLRISSLIVPDSVIVRLRYLEASDAITHTSADAINYYWNATSLYAPYPGITGALSGFPEWSNFYQAYRVLRSTINVRIINEDTFPVKAFLWPMPVGVTNNTLTKTQIENYGFENKFAKTAFLSSGGANPSGRLYCKLRQSLTQPEMYGSDQCLYDDNFAAAVSASPTNMFYWFVGATCANAVTFTNGIGIELSIEFEAILYDRVLLSA